MRYFSQIYDVYIIETSEFWVLGFGGLCLSAPNFSLTTELLKGFSDIVLAPSPYLIVVKFFPFFLNRSYDSNTLSVEFPLSLWSNTTPTAVLFYRYFS
jgi:hypothetical protein